MRHAVLFATSLAGLIAAAPVGRAWAEAPFDFDRAPGKLPKDVVPLAYRIDLRPDLGALTLAGTEAVDVQVRAATGSITLNQAGLTVRSASLEDGSAAGITEDEKAQTVTLRFARPVGAGRHTLSIAYSGPIPQTPNGIYYDDYKVAAGARRMLVTQFETTDARRMFPGWDEPAFKATFTLSVTLPPGLTVISNMPVRATSVAGALRKTEFAATPRMSTYLLALVAGDLQAVRGQAGATALAVWAPTGEAEQGRYALAVESRTLPYYNEYFGVAYPLPKLDMVAIPGNFEAGAMENWGAITYIDDALLFDSKNSSPATRETIQLDVTHEMAHQWSGDLVTMGWWDNIWLNEGFATWMELKATDHFNPTWEIWPRQHEEREAAMGQDALPTTHAVQQVIHTESEANTAFDGISYQKGSQIIRMVEDWIGPDVFRDGMRRYMRAHAYSNTTSADLWSALGGAAHRDVAGVAASFTEQPGIPLVHVAETCSGNAARITLTQDRFTIHDPHPASLTWRVPVSLGAPGSATRQVLLGAAPLALSAGRCGAPLKANLGEDGYYRTQYDGGAFKRLVAHLRKFPAADRANVLGDQFALFMAARAPLADYLSALGADGGEQDIAVWTDTIAHLERIDKALIGSALRPRFARFAALLIRPEAARVGWDAKPGEPFLDGVLRPQLIDALGRFNDAAILAEARRRFDAFVLAPDGLAPGLREPVLRMVGRTADQATYDRLKQLGVRATGTEEKLRYFSAMASAADPKLVAQSVAFAEAGEVPNGRIADFLYDISRTSERADLVYKLVEPRQVQLAARMPPGSIGPGVLAAAAAGSSDPAVARALLAAPSSNASAGAHIWAARVADGIGTAADLRTRIVPQLTAWLDGGGY